MTTILREPFVSLSAWSNPSFQFTIIPGGRTGTGAQALAGADARFSIPLAVQSDWVTLGFAVMLLPDMTSPHYLGFLSNEDGFDNGFYQFNLYITDTGAVQVNDANSAATYATTAAGLIAANVWYYIEFQIRLHATAGAAKIRINNVERASVSGIPTWSFGLPTIARLYLYGGTTTGQTHLFDDLYFKTGAGETFMGDTAFGPEARESRASARVGFSEPSIDWYRSSRASLRAAFSEPPTKDWYRSSRSSVRVAFQGATTSARLGAMEVRVLTAPSGGTALVSQYLVRVLAEAGAGGNALVDTVALQVLRPFVGPDARFWDGAAYIAGPVRLWDGAAFHDALAVKLWDGSDWVDAI